MKAITAEKVENTEAVFNVEYQIKMRVRMAFNNMYLT